MTSPIFLCTKELARRWKLAPNTLDRWRHLGHGPSFIKLGGNVRYRQDIIERYEAQHSQNSPQLNVKRIQPSRTSCSAQITPHGTKILSFYSENDFGRNS